MSFGKILSKPIEKKTVKRLIDLELSRIVDVCKPEKVFLFGSAAREEMTDSSDLDFLIVLPLSANLKEVRKMYYRSVTHREVAVDTIFVTSEEFTAKVKIGGVCMICADEGILLYSGAFDRDSI